MGTYLCQCYVFEEVEAVVLEQRFYFRQDLKELLETSMAVAAVDELEVEALALVAAAAVEAEAEKELYKAVWPLWLLPNHDYLEEPILQQLRRRHRPNQ